MSAAMDMALMAMSLEEEDKPFNMPDLPQFSSCERNSKSLIGRILNPPCQKMSNLILDIPRKWQKGNRVRGIALSKERFQFFFDHEYELEEVLNKGFHMFEEWGLAMERWPEPPSPDCLQYVTLWVQIKNIPMTYYTDIAITALGDLVGKIMVAFDPEKLQSQEYVRAKVSFNVANPLHKTRMVNLPKGGQAEIRYFYERVQKRCYHCQRLTHERDVCHILIRARQQEALERITGVSTAKPAKEPFLKPDDPLFGVLQEIQVGFHPVLGRTKIAHEVPEGMRQYLKFAEGGERKISEDRIRKSVREVEQNPATERMVLRLEDPPINTKDLKRGKGRVFGYEMEANKTDGGSGGSGSQKLLGAAIKAGKGSALVPYGCNSEPSFSETSNYSAPSFSVGNSTGFNVSFYEATSSRITNKKARGRKRPGTKARRLRKLGDQPLLSNDPRGSGSESGLIEKRKAPEEGSEGRVVSRRKPNEMVPNEGPSQS